MRGSVAKKIRALARRAAKKPEHINIIYKAMKKKYMQNTRKPQKDTL